MDEVFSIGAAFLPFGTLLTGSTIGTDNEKSTKVWTGDAENEPVQLVAYNADGTLPNNKVYYGTYTGDGTTGKSSSTPMSITFPFAPKMIHMFGTSKNTSNPQSIYSTDSSNSTVVTAVDLTKVSTSFTADGAWRNGLDYTIVYNKLSSDGKTYSWYTTSTASSNMFGIFNTSNTKYHYIAFG